MNTAKILSAAALAIAGQASATVLDFEEFRHEGQFMQLGNQVFHKTYVLTVVQVNPFGLAAVGHKWPHNLRSTAMVIGVCGRSVELKKDDNNPFRIRSIDLDELNGGTAKALVTFIGTKTNGTTVKHAVRTNGLSTWQRFYFPERFKNLYSLTWTQGCTAQPTVPSTEPHMFDNLTVSR